MWNMHRLSSPLHAISHSEENNTSTGGGICNMDPEKSDNKQKNKRKITKIAYKILWEFPRMCFSRILFARCGGGSLTHTLICSQFFVKFCLLLYVLANKMQFFFRISIFPKTNRNTDGATWLEGGDICTNFFCLFCIFRFDFGKLSGFFLFVFPIKFSFFFAWIFSTRKYFRSGSVESPLVVVGGAAGNLVRVGIRPILRVLLRPGEDVDPDVVCHLGGEGFRFSGRSLPDQTPSWPSRKTNKIMKSAKEIKAKKKRNRNVGKKQYKKKQKQSKPDDLAKCRYPFWACVDHWLANVSLSLSTREDPGTAKFTALLIAIWRVLLTRPHLPIPHCHMEDRLCFKGNHVLLQRHYIKAPHQLTHVNQRLWDLLYYHYFLFIIVYHCIIYYFILLFFRIYFTSILILFSFGIILWFMLFVIYIIYIYVYKYIYTLFLMSQSHHQLFFSHLQLVQPIQLIFFVHSVLCQG